MAEGCGEDNSDNTVSHTNCSRKTDLDTFKKDVSRVKSVLRRLSTLPDEIFEEHTQYGSCDVDVDTNYRRKIHSALSRLNSFVETDDIGNVAVPAGNTEYSPHSSIDQNRGSEKEDQQSITCLSSALLKQLDNIGDAKHSSDNAEPTSDANMESSGCKRGSMDSDISCKSNERIVNQEDVDEIVTRLCEIADEFNQKYTPTKLMFFRSLVRMTWLFFYVSMKSVE